MPVDLNGLNIGTSLSRIFNATRSPNTFQASMTIVAVSLVSRATTVVIDSFMSCEGPRRLLP